MNEERIDIITEEPAAAGPWRRISWGGIFAGLFVTMAAMLWLSLLGMAVGLSTESARNQAQSAAGNWITAAGVWTFVSALIALFCGGFVAARMSGNPRSSDGAWHGVVQWAFAVVVSVWVLSWGLQTAIGLSMEAAGIGMAADRGAVGAAAENQAQRLAGELGVRNLSSADLQTLAARLGSGNYDAAADLLADRSNGTLTRERAHARIEEAVGAARRRAADFGASAGWVAVATMFFGLCASALGGAAGATTRFDGRSARRMRTETAGTAPTVGRPVGA